MNSSLFSSTSFLFLFPISLHCSLFFIILLFLIYDRVYRVVDELETRKFAMVGRDKTWRGAVIVWKRWTKVYWVHLNEFMCKEEMNCFDDWFGFLPTNLDELEVREFSSVLRCMIGPPLVLVFCFPFFSFLLNQRPVPVLFLLFWIKGRSGSLLEWNRINNYDFDWRKYSR